MYLLCVVWTVYEQVVIAALDCGEFEQANVRKYFNANDFLLFSLAIPCHFEEAVS